MALIKDFCAAWQVLLAVPMPVDTRGSRHSALFYPVVGGLVGLAIAGVGFTGPFFPASVAAALMLGASYLLTGCLHWDGWADCWDGYACRYDKERMIKAMRDSRVGSCGAAALIILLLLKFSLYSGLAGSWHLIWLHSASRLGLVLAAKISPPAEEGSGAAFARQVKWYHIGGGLLFAGIVTWLLAGIAGILAICIGIGAGVGFSHWFSAMAGGVRGDILGAGQQVVLTASMLAFMVAMP